MIAFVVATSALSALAVLVFSRWSARALLDRPGARSSHRRPTPTGGGFPAVLVGLCALCLAALRSLVPVDGAVWAATFSVVVLASVGLLDDARDLPRSVRLATHGLVAGASVGFVALDGRGFGLAQGLFALIALVALINIFNFMDGIDALVASNGGLVLAFIAWRTGDARWLLFAAAYAGFLFFNLPPARIFMGDAGSTTLGALVGIAALAGSERLHPSALVVLVPLGGDAVYTLARRLLRGEDVRLAHHSHVYQRLYRAGLSHGRISALYAAATSVAGLLAVALETWGAVAFTLLALVVLLATERWLSARRVPFARPVAPSVEA